MKLIFLFNIYTLGAFARKENLKKKTRNVLLILGANCLGQCFKENCKHSFLERKLDEKFRIRIEIRFVKPRNTI